MKKLILLTAFLFIIIVSCSSTPEFVGEPKQVDYLTNGVWIGILPCADCEGIDYTLNLKNDFTFKQKSVYKGKDEELFIDDGEWSFVSDSVILVEGLDESKMFLVDGKKLTMLDEYGNRIKSSDEHKYYLRKDTNDVSEVDKVEPVNEVAETNATSYDDMFINGIDFFAMGNEPFWTLEIDVEKEMRFTTLYDIKLNIPSVERQKEQNFNVNIYHAKTKSGELVVTITRADCEDDMSGEQFNYTVKVEAKSSADNEFKTFEGCGQYLYDTRLHDIWVMEQMTGVKLNKTKLTKGLPIFEFYPEEMRFGGHTGCNSLSDRIAVVGDKIIFGNLMGTLMACPDMSVERAVVKAIDQKTVTYSIENLKLTLVSGKTKMVFKKID